MQSYHEQQNEPRRPYELGIGLQQIAIAVDGLPAKEDLKIAGQVSKHKQEQDKACHGHDVLLAERRIKNVRSDIHERPEARQP
jgi:hypothetical protein